MTSIEQHIQHDKEIIDDPTKSAAARRHAKDELHDLIEYEEHHHEENSFVTNIQTSLSA